jgi:hypothetical protein
MEKLLAKKQTPFHRLRLPEYKERPAGKLLPPPAWETKSRHYPHIKMPVQPQGYIKCREHDCL